MGLNDEAQSKEEARKKVLQFLMGDKPQQEGVQPTGSPLDFIPYAGLAGAGARAATGGLSSLARMAALKRLAGNEVGAIGEQAIAKRMLPMPTGTPINPMTPFEASKLNPALAEYKATGAMSPEIQQASNAGERALADIGAHEEAEAVKKAQLRDVGIDPLDELFRQQADATNKKVVSGMSGETQPSLGSILPKKKPSFSSDEE